MLFMMVSCFIIIFRNGGGDVSVDATLRMYPMTIVLIIVNIVFGVFVFGMLGFHSYLLIFNITTSEYLKDYWQLNSGNPFRK